MYENNPSKIIGLIFAIAVSIVTTPLVYLVILYEKENPYKTLLSQVFCNILTIGIFYVILVEIPDYALYIYGPLPECICYVEIMLRGGITIQQLILTNAVIIVRYIFLFHVKNPTATQHDYWTLFLVVWSLACAIVSSTVFLFLPGNNPNYFYICLGKIPNTHKNSKTKTNILLIVIILVTLIIHVILGSKMKVYYKKQKLETILTLAPTANVSTVVHSNKYNLYTVTTHLIGLAAYLIFYVPAFQIQYEDLKSFENYPSFLWIYIFHFYSIQTFTILFLVILFRKNKPLTKFVKRRVCIFFGINLV